MVAHQEKPVASPSHVTTDLAVAGHLHRHVCSQAIAGNVVDRDFTVGMEDGADGSHRSLDAVLSGLNPLHKGERRHQTDGSVPAHAEIADVVKEDHGGGAGGIHGIAQQRADHNIRPSRLVDDGRSKIVVLTAKALQSLDERSLPEIGTSAHHQARGLAAGVRIDYANSLALTIAHVSAQGLPDFK